MPSLLFLVISVVKALNTLSFFFLISHFNFNLLNVILVLTIRVCIILQQIYIFRAPSYLRMREHRS